MSKQWYISGQHPNMLMMNDEVACIVKHLKPHHRMLEWGSGGSTSYFSRLVDFYMSIEHDQAWYNKVVSSGLSEGKVMVVHVPISNEFDWDEELDKEAHNLLRYCQDVSNKDGILYWQTRSRFDWHRAMDYIKYPLRDTVKYDRILVDGRARIFCAYTALKILADDGLVFIHDFNNRPHYHSVLDYYDVVEREDTLVVLKKKN